jgi:hypothetical protein
VNYRSGDMWSPQLEQIEALRQELSYLWTVSRRGRTLSTTDAPACRVVKMLEAASESMSKRGSLVYL